MTKILNIYKIKDFYNLLETDEHNRYDSWKHCYNTFNNINQDDDFLALHLGFYFASWGGHTVEVFDGNTGLVSKVRLLVDASNL